MIVKKNKVYLLTIHIGFNFGSSLQAIATSNILKKYANDVVILNYHPERVTYKGFFKKMFSSPKELIKSLFAFPNYMLNRHIYYSYLKNYLDLSRIYYSEKELQNVVWDGDIYVTGSDQVWNSKYNGGIDPIYFWSFLPMGNHIISLASSLGIEQLPEHEFIAVKKLLSKYRKISVREKSAQAILSSMGYQAEHLLDPTLLLTDKEWRPYMKRRIIKEFYLLVYIPYNIVSKETIYSTARKIAEERNLKVVTFSWTYIPDSFADKTIFYASPSDFLTLMEYAECIVTNSFHGTAFSINLNKQFWVYDPAGFSTRIESLIEMCGLRNRRLSEIISKERVNEIIDYTSVNEILEKERQRAFSFLSDSFA